MSRCHRCLSGGACRWNSSANRETYGWPAALTDDELLAKLLEMNLAQSAAVASGA